MLSLVQYAPSDENLSVIRLIACIVFEKSREPSDPRPLTPQNRDQPMPLTNMNPLSRSSTVSTVSEGGLSVREEELVKQLVTRRYLDQDKLKTFLNKTFPGRWKVEIKNNQYTIGTPRTLTEVISAFGDLAHHIH